jgi:hypothetical protein
MNRIKTILALLVLLAIPIMSKAQFANGDSINPCHIKVSCSTYGAAITNSKDTYLSNEIYFGSSWHYGHENFRYAHTGTYMWKYRTGFSGMLGTATFHDSYQYILTLNRTWSGYHTFTLNDEWSFLAGPIIEVAGGAIYMPGNSNNPVSAKLRTSLGVSGMLLLRSQMRKRSITTRFQVDMALLGMAFSPEYGESYYEIFGLGNYDNIVHFTHPGNVLALRLTTAIDIPLGKKQKNILRVALNSDIYSSKINGLHTDIRYLPVSLGFVKTLYKIKGKNPLKQYTPY